jgi:signal transduction histidine kinase
MPDLGASSGAAGPGPLPGWVPSILVVDDTPANLELLSNLLQAWGYEPRPVLSGRQALAAARAEPPDLILLDVRMPEMDGLEVCAQLKADAALKDIPVIFITALTETADKIKAFALGAVDYVTEPFQAEEVRARVEAHLEIRRQQRALQQAYDRLAQFEGLRDSLVHMVAHDLRSPLTVILTSLELAEMDRAPRAPEEYLVNAKRSARLLIEMVSSMLDVSKLEAGQMPLEIATVDLGTLARSVLREVEPLRGQRKLTLIAPAELAPIEGDTGLLRRVLQNLIANALKFTSPARGAITVCLTATGGGLRVAVADNGRGIPVEYREKVFDKFCQVAAHRQGQVYSTGLGLTFCKLAVEAHGGRIGLESIEGQGSTFWFEVPRRPPAAGGAAVASPNNSRKNQL